MRVVSVLSMGALLAAAAWAQADAPPHGHLYGIVARPILLNVNASDAKAAMKVWFDELAGKRGYVLDSRVEVLDDAREIRERLRSGGIDLLVLDTRSYLELESSRLIVPVLAPTRGPGGPLFSYVWLAREDMDLAGLRNRRLMVSSRTSRNAGSIWVDVLLGREKLGRAVSFFSSIQQADKPQACILSVFFGTADACAVDEINLNVAKEMNPQLGKLRVLGRSNPLIESLIAMSPESEAYQKELIDAMLALPHNARGRQLLAVFRTERLALYEPAELDSARELWKEYDRLMAASPHAGPVH